MSLDLTRFAYTGRCSSALVCLVLLPLVGVLAQTVKDPRGCSEELQKQALTKIYTASNGTGWREQSLWNTNGTCVQALQLRTANYTGGAGARNVTLPSYCCWSGVDCCLSGNYDGNYTQCAQYQCNCTVGTVTGLSLGHNGLVGELQSILNDDVLDVLACSMRLIFLGGNGLRGFIPPGMSKLQDLQILSLSSNNLTGSIPESLTSLAGLEELDLANNALNGTVPPMLCGGADRESKLRDLILSNNQFTGELSLPSCEALIYLDVQNNNLHGPMLDISSYRQLHILRLGNNYFSGTVDVDSFDLRLVVLMDLSLNFFNGPLPNFVGNSSQMTNLRLQQNNFSGTISPDFFTVGTMAVFVANNNSLTGTLPENIGNARGINNLNLRSNDLHGKLPESLRDLAPNLGTVDVSLTHMSCCGYDYVQGEGYLYFNMSAPKLPSFLVASQLNRPVVDTGLQLKNMRCPFIQVDPHLTADEFVTWALDPEYYLYEGCSCLGGYDEVWSNPVAGEPSMGPLLQCVEIKEPWYIRYPWAVVLIVLGGLLVALWLTYLMCFRRGKNAAIVQGCFNIRKRIQGEPVGGQVSIVVTDIEGYSDLMKQSPELMTRALNLHNAIVRKSRWSNFGYTLEQEGDSFALVFYEAHDAVVFCLQTQLALNKQTWPEGLFGFNLRDGAAKRRQPPPSLLNAISVMTNNLTHSLFGGRASMQDDRSGTSFAEAAGPRTGHTSMDGHPDSRQSSAATGFAAAGPPAAAGGHELSCLMFGPSATAAAGPSGTAAAGAASGVGASVGALGALGAGSSTRGHPVLFNGLRVRMGVATGALPPGSNSKGSAVMDMAKVVSDAANGGQVMIDEATFKAIKERIEELGAVDHNGMNYKKLNSIQPPWYSCLKRKHRRNPDDALLLDMGEYTHCPGSKRLPLFQLEATTAAETPVEGPPGAPGPLPLPPATPRGSGRRGKGYEPMRLYQVVPPPLVSRAKVFGNKVTVKDEWYCSDAPYFDAPGTLEAPLGAVDGPVALPAITMAFAIVEGGKTFASRNRRDVRRVNDVCAACIRACLRVVRGGYLCRLQDGDLKYMVAFATAEAAVEWSLLLQDVLMYADWPEAALKFWREEYDDRGRLVFRGPRMKIGLCEGCPRSIIPDHIGRADYHGASVNQAARYMDAAAHGGMIAIEASLAIKVMDTWRAAAAAAEAAVTAAAAAGTSGAVASAAAVAAVGVAATSSTGVKSAPAITSAFAVAGASAAAAAAASVSSISTSTGGSVKAGRLSSSTARDGAAAPPQHPPSRSTSRKGRMAAVQEADGAEDQPAAATAPAPLAASLPMPPAAPAPSSGPGPRPTSRSGVSEPLMTRGGGGAATGGPVAEAIEDDGADGPDPAAAASAAKAAEAVVGNGKAAEAVAVAATTAAVTQCAGESVSRPNAESGPSMTSLASSARMGPAIVSTSSSTTTAPPPLLPFGSPTSETDSPVAATATTATATAGFGLSHRPAPLTRVPSANPSCDGSLYTENAAVAMAAVAAALPHGGIEPATDSPLAAPSGRMSAPGFQQQPPHMDLQPTGSATLPPRPRPAGGHPLPSALRNPAAGPRTHVSFAAERAAGVGVGSHPIIVADSPTPSPASSLPHRAPSSAAASAPSTSAPPFASGPSASGPSASAVPPLSPSTSAIRSPRPPALPPLSLPSERERDESLRAERAAAEAAKVVSVDGPADASYPAHVLVLRIGVFRFKGNPEPIEMAHVVLEHLAGRRFPADAPKGKGAKVGDSTGLVAECDTSLPDLAAFMRDRYMLLNGPIAGRAGLGSLGLTHSLTMDTTASSPNNRRLRALLGSSSATVPNANSPRAGAGSGLGKSRSLATTRGSSGAPGSVANSTSDGGVSPTAGGSDRGSGGSHRRGPGLMSHIANFAASSMRWRAEKVPGTGGGAQAPAGDAAAAAGADRRLQSGGEAHTDTTSAPAQAEVTMVVVPVAGGQGRGSEAAPPPPAGAGGGTASGDSTDPRVGRPSRLRQVSGRDAPLPDQGQQGATTAIAPAIAAVAEELAAGDSISAPRGDERV